MERLLILLPLALMAACASPDLVVLLPGEGGKTGALVVQSNDREVVLDSPHVAARIRNGDEDIETDRISGRDIRRYFAAALAAQPPAPQYFTLYFEEGSTRLMPSSRAELVLLIAEVQKREAVDVQITGHTDRVGELAYNDRLSRRRAREIRSALMDMGLQASVIRVAGRGEREPLIRTADEVREPRNRRVEVIVR